MLPPNSSQNKSFPVRKKRHISSHTHKSEVTTPPARWDMMGARLRRSVMGAAGSAGAAGTGSAGAKRPAVRRNKGAAALSILRMIKHKFIIIFIVNTEKS